MVKVKALIIGASGFVGSYLVSAVREELGCELYVTRRTHAVDMGEDVQSFELDILDADAVGALLEQVRPDYIFHLAAQSSIGLSWQKPRLTVEINVKGSLNLLNAIRRLDYQPRILLVGSGEEYGYINPENVPITETEVLRPGNIYAATKACQSLMGKVYADAYNMRMFMVRAFNHMGPGQSDKFVVSDFCKQVAQIELGFKPPLISVGNLEAERDFTDVRDMVRAYTSVIQFGVPGEIYNVGSGKAIKIRKILDVILSQSRTKIEVQIDPAKLRPSDIPIIAADTSKLYETTGWKPEIPLEQTVSDVLEYWRSELRRDVK